MSEDSLKEAIRRATEEVEAMEKAVNDLLGPPEHEPRPELTLIQGGRDA